MAASIWLSSAFEQRRLVYTDAAKIAAQYGYKELAEQLVKEAEKKKGSPLSQETLEQIFPEQKILTDLEIINTVLVQQPSYVPWLLSKAQLLIRLKRDAEAQEVLATIETLDPNNPEVRSVLDGLYSALASSSAASSPLP